MIIKKELIKREIAGDTILVPVGKSVYDSNGLYLLNELGAFIWDLLPDAESEEDIYAAVMAQYEVPAETVKKDVLEFLQTLQEMGVL